MADKLFTSPDDFRDSILRGMAIFNKDESLVPPSQQHLADMKALYAVFLAVIVDVNSELPLQPDFANKASSVRMALLAAYNLGKQAAETK